MRPELASSCAVCLLDTVWYRACCNRPTLSQNLLPTTWPVKLIFRENGCKQYSSSIPLSGVKQRHKAVLHINRFTFVAVSRDIVHWLPTYLFSRYPCSQYIPPLYEIGGCSFVCRFISMNFAAALASPFN